MSNGDYIDLVAPRPPSPSSPGRSRQPVEPFVVQLPDELLRQIFELATLSNPHTARQLLLVSKWVYKWLVQLVYETLIVKSHGDFKRAMLRSPRLLGYARNVWIELGDAYRTCMLSVRLSDVTRLFIKLDSRNLGLAVLPSHSATHLRELYIEHYVFLLTLPMSALTTLTHLRLDPLTIKLTFQLSQPDTLPALTHLIIDADAWTYDDSLAPTYGTEYTTILSAPSRRKLEILVVVVQSSASFFKEVIELGLDRLVVLHNRPGFQPRNEWLAECKGESGFWQRVKQFGVCAGSAQVRGYSEDTTPS